MPPAVDALRTFPPTREPQPPQRLPATTVIDCRREGEAVILSEVPGLLSASNGPLLCGLAIVVLTTVWIATFIPDWSALDWHDYLWLCAPILFLGGWLALKRRGRRSWTTLTATPETLRMTRIGRSRTWAREQVKSVGIHTNSNGLVGELAELQVHVAGEAPVRVFVDRARQELESIAEMLRAALDRRPETLSPKPVAGATGASGAAPSPDALDQLIHLHRQLYDSGGGGRLTPGDLSVEPAPYAALSPLTLEYAGPAAVVEPMGATSVVRHARTPDGLTVTEKGGGDVSELKAMILGVGLMFGLIGLVILFATSERFAARYSPWFAAVVVVSMAIAVACAAGLLRIALDTFRLAILSVSSRGIALIVTAPFRRQTRRWAPDEFSSVVAVPVGTHEVTPSDAGGDIEDIEITNQAPCELRLYLHSDPPLRLFIGHDPQYLSCLARHIRSAIGGCPCAVQLVPAPEHTNPIRGSDPVFDGLFDEIFAEPTASVVK